MSSRQRHSSAPPASPMRSAIIVSSGSAITRPMTRGTTSTSKGSTPVAFSASTSSLSCMAPISAAKALPERPATMIAVSSTPSSRSTPMVTRSTTKISAPNRCSCCALMYAMITLIRKRDQRHDRDRGDARVIDVAHDGRDAQACGAQLSDRAQRRRPCARRNSSAETRSRQRRTTWRPSASTGSTSSGSSYWRGSGGSPGACPSLICVVFFSCGGRPRSGRRSCALAQQLPGR